MSVKKRFIAGAVCPQCNTADSLRWWLEHRVERVECVECHYTAQHLPTSLEQNEKAAGQTVIGIFKPD